MNKKERAINCFKEGFSCSQAVFSTHAVEGGLNRETVLKISDAFGTGMALGSICGAVTGAMMVIGLKYGRTKPDDEEAKLKTRSLIREFVKEFETRNDSIECKKLLGYDITIPEEMAIAEEKGLFDTFCPKLIENAMDILEKLLNLKY